MGTARRTRPAQPAATPPDGAASPGTRAVVERDPLDDMLAEFGTGTGHFIRLQRRSGMRWDYVPGAKFDVTPDLVEHVGQQYGGGAYKALVYEPPSKYLRTIEFSIAGRAFGVEGEADGGSAPGAVPDYVARLERAVERLAERVQQPAGTDQALGMVSAVVGLLAPMFKGQRGDSGPDVASTLTLVEHARAEGMRIGQTMGELKAGAPSDGGIAEAMKAWAPVAERAFAARSAAPVRSIAAPPGAAGAPAQNPPPEQTMTLPAGYEWLRHVAPYFAQLGDAAAAGESPEATADAACDHMPVFVADAVEKVAEREDFAATLTAAVPALAAAHPAWLEAFVARLQHNMTPDDGADAEE